MPPPPWTPSWLENEQHTAGTLTITYEIVDGCMTQSYSESIILNGNYAPNAVTLLSDPWGGTEVVYGVRQAWAGGTSDQWNTASNWSNAVVPGTTDTAIIDNVGHQPVTIGDAEQVANLVIDSHATLEIADGGALTVTNALDDAGTIDVNATGSDPTLVMYGPVRVEGGAEIDADGTFASVTFFKDQVGNAGDISANNQGTVLFEGSVVFNQDGGVIEAATLSTVTFDNATVANQGGATIEANGGQVLFDHSTITNDESHHSLCRRRGIVHRQLRRWQRRFHPGRRGVGGEACRVDDRRRRDRRRGYARSRRLEHAQRLRRCFRCAHQCRGRQHAHARPCLD